MCTFWYIQDNRLLGLPWIGISKCIYKHRFISTLSSAGRFIPILSSAGRFISTLSSAEHKTNCRIRKRNNWNFIHIDIENLNNKGHDLVIKVPFASEVGDLWSNLRSFRIDTLYICRISTSHIQLLEQKKKRQNNVSNRTTWQHTFCRMCKNTSTLTYSVLYFVKSYSFILSSNESWIS